MVGNLRSVQGKQVQSLSREDPTCRGAAQPARPEARAQLRKARAQALCPSPMDGNEGVVTLEKAKYRCQPPMPQAGCCKLVLSGRPRTSETA